ncbi:MAG: hypothetical protein ABGY42_08910 [bacterium]
MLDTLTVMCPTGWLIPAPDGPNYLNDALAPIHKPGELKSGDVRTPTESVS